MAGRVHPNMLALLGARMRQVEFIERVGIGRCSHHVEFRQKSNVNARPYTKLKTISHVRHGNFSAEVVFNEGIHGSIAGLIFDEARRAGCDLIVMGAHGQRGLRRLALGSEAAAAARHSPVPVLLVKNDPVTG